MWLPRLTPVWANAFGPPHATFWAGPSVVTATRTARELAWLCSAARPHYSAAGFDVVCEALPALLQPVALPPGHRSSCQQVSLLPLILPWMHDTHAHTQGAESFNVEGRHVYCWANMHKCTNTCMECERGKLLLRLYSTHSPSCVLWNVHTHTQTHTDVHARTPDTPTSCWEIPILFWNKIFWEGIYCYDLICYINKREQ